MIDIQITDVRPLPGDSGFLVYDKKTAILYDTGFAFTGYRLAENVRSVLGGRPLDYIFLTHSHYDHASGTAYVLKSYPEATVVAGEYAKTVFERPTARARMRDLDRKFALKCGVGEYEDLIDELRVDVTVKDGDVLRCGDMTFRVIALPGHTKCSVGYYLEENKLLLGTETLGVYFGDNTYLPSYLVGYGITMDSFARAKALDIESILLPHYGAVHREEARAYLENSERVSRETASAIRTMIAEGKSKEEITEYFKRMIYKENVAPTYPIDAFELNTSIMIDLIARERSNVTAKNVF